MLKDKHDKQEEMKTNFLISDNVWAKATIPNDTGKVGLWLGANVMIEYSHDEALALLERNLKNAEIRIASTEEDLNFLKDQITTTEVNIARCYNQTVANDQKKKEEEKKTNFLISDIVWAKATIPNYTGKVSLWLGANVMIDYSNDKAHALLERNLKNAKIRIDSSEEDLNFLNDQIDHQNESQNCSLLQPDCRN